MCSEVWVAPSGMGTARRRGVLPRGRSRVLLWSVARFAGVAPRDFDTSTLKEIGATRQRRRWWLPYSEDALSLLLWAAPPTELDASPLFLSGSSRQLTRTMHNSPATDDAERLLRSLLLGVASGRRPSAVLGVKEP